MCMEVWGGIAQRVISAKQGKLALETGPEKGRCGWWSLLIVKLRDFLLLAHSDNLAWLLATNARSFSSTSSSSSSFFSPSFSPFFFGGGLLFSHPPTSPLWLRLDLIHLSPQDLPRFLLIEGGPCAQYWCLYHSVPLQTPFSLSRFHCRGRARHIFLPQVGVACGTS